MDLIAIVISILLLTIFAGVLIYAWDFFSYVFPPMWVAIFMIIVVILALKFVLGRNHG